MPNRTAPFLSRSLAIVVAAALVASCGSGKNGQASNPGAAPSALPPAPVIASFTANPPSVVTGGSTTLSWEINDPAAKVKLSPGEQEITGNSATVSPVITTTYTLTVTNVAGSAIRSLTIAVSSSQLPVGTDVASTAPPPDTRVWHDGTGTLVGKESECGNLPYVSGKPLDPANPTADTMIASVALKGLWVSQGGSDDWQQLGNSAKITNRASAIIYDPDHPNTFWETGIYNGGGFYRTDDNGATFTPLGDLEHTDLVAIDFSDPQRLTMLSGRHEAPNLYLSKNGGQTWADVSLRLPMDAGYTGGPLIIDTTTFLLGTSHGSKSGIFKSTDGGLTWNMTYKDGPVVGAPLRLKDGSAIFWSLQNGAGMIRSVDNGDTWQLLPQGPGSTNSTSILELPDGRIAAVSGDSFVTTSADHGDTWQRVGAQMPYMPNGIAYSAARDTFYAWQFICDLNTDDNDIHPMTIIWLGAP